MRRAVAQERAMTKQEFSIRFLLAAHHYIYKVARALIRECQEDIQIFGMEFAQQKWAKFVGI